MKIYSGVSILFSQVIKYDVVNMDLRLKKFGMIYLIQFHSDKTNSLNELYKFNLNVINIYTNAESNTIY